MKQKQLKAESRKIACLDAYPLRTKIAQGIIKPRIEGFERVQELINYQESERKSSPFYAVITREQVFYEPYNTTLMATVVQIDKPSELKELVAKVEKAEFEAGWRWDGRQFEADKNMLLEVKTLTREYRNYAEISKTPVTYQEAKKLIETLR